MRYTLALNDFAYKRGEMMALLGEKPMAINTGVPLWSGRGHIVRPIVLKQSVGRREPGAAIVRGYGKRCCSASAPAYIEATAEN